MTLFRALIALAALVLAACSSSMPTTTDMDRYYLEAEKQAQRDIDRLAESRNRGAISSEEYQRREAAIKESIPRRASMMAWARHELTQSEFRAASIPTPDTPVQVAAPGRGGGGGSFYHQAGQTGGAGYQGAGSGVVRGYQPGSATTSSSLRN